MRGSSSWGSPETGSAGALALFDDILSGDHPAFAAGSPSRLTALENRASLAVRLRRTEDVVAILQAALDEAIGQLGDDSPRVHGLRLALEREQDRE